MIRLVRRLEHTLAILQKRIHLLEGFALVFQDLDKALRIIRSARSRQEAEQGLRENFPLDDEQIEAVLERACTSLWAWKWASFWMNVQQEERGSRNLTRSCQS